MNLKVEIYPYVIGIVIIILTIFFGLGNIPYETFWTIVLALLGVQGATIYGSVNKRIGTMERNMGIGIDKSTETPEG